MEQTLQELLDEIKGRIAENKTLAEGIALSNAERDHWNKNRVVYLASQLLPECVREYVRFLQWVTTNSWIVLSSCIGQVVIELPDAAPIIMTVQVIRDSKQWVEDVALCKNGLGPALFMLGKYEVGHDEDEESGWNLRIAYRTWQKYETFFQALENAIEAGNNKEVVEKQAALVNEMNLLEEPEQDLRVKCPLNVEEGYCIKDRCAWWLASGSDMCAIKSLGIG